MDDLLQEFCKAVLTQADLIHQGQASKANRQVDVYNRAARELKRLPGGREALAALMDDERPMVRVAAAAHLLRRDDDRALRFLGTMAESLSGMPAVVAGIALLQWETGAWDPDAEPPPRPKRGKRTTAARR
jgi:hypothetical protein